MGRYGKSIDNYVSEISGFKLIKEQIDLLSLMKEVDKYKNIAASCGRGFSKTMLSAGAMLWFGDEYASGLSQNGKGRDLEILMVSSQPRLYWHLNQFFEKNKERFGYDEQKKKYARLKHGGIYDALMKEKAELYTKDFKHVTTFYPVMATSKGARSHRADIVILDETAEMPRDTIIAAQGCLTGDICKLIMLSTPHKAGSMFNEIVANPDEYDFRVFNASAEVCPWQKQSNDRAKKTLTPSEYAMEIQGRVPTADERSYFPPKHIEACIQDIEPFPEGGVNSIKEVGIDFGYASTSGTIYVLTEKIGTVKRKVLKILCWKERSIEDLAPEIAEHILVDKPKYIKADSRPAFNKGHIEKYCRRTIRYIDPEQPAIKKDKTDMFAHLKKIPTIKETMLGQLQRKLREHNLILPNTIELMPVMVKQLKKYSRGMSVGDDFVDALALSCYEPIEGYEDSHCRVVFGENLGY
jgi:hypothetical protein